MSKGSARLSVAANIILAIIASAAIGAGGGEPAAAPTDAAGATGAVRSEARGPMAEAVLAWDQISTDTIARRLERGLKPGAPFELPHTDPLTGVSRMVLVEQRRFGVNYANPAALARAFEIAATSGLGHFYYEPETAEFAVADTPDRLELMKRYHDAMDTPRPAWLFAFPPERAMAALERLKAGLPSGAEMLPFPVAGTIIVRGAAEDLLMAEEIVNKAQLGLSPGAAALSSGWNQIPESARQAREERGPVAPMAFTTAAPRGGAIAVEQRRHPVEHAAPSELLKAFRPLLTPGIGRAHFDAATAELVVLDQAEVHGRLQAYLKALDTARPARLLRPAKGLTDAARAAILENLSPDGEMLPFEDGAIVIVRDDEIHLSRVEVALRFVDRPAMPVAGPEAGAGLHGPPTPTPKPAL